MTFLLTAYAAPVTNITAPLYHIYRKDTPAHAETDKLIFALLRTATVVAFFFADIPFAYIFGDYTDLSVNVAFMARFLIHPYAAALHTGFINGGVLLIEKVMEVFIGKSFTLTPDDVGNFVIATAFFHIAQLIEQPQIKGFLDQKYSQFSHAFATKVYPQPEQKENEKA